MEAFVGTILPFGFDFAPVNWMTCQGQTLQVNQYTVVYALLGNRFGGNGSTNFMLPNLQGRMPVGIGQGPLGVLVQGQQGGSPSATLTQNNLPSAMVDMLVSSNTEDNQNAPSAQYPYMSASGRGPGGAAIWSNTMTNPQSVQGLSLAGGSQPFSVMNPFLALNFTIAMQGLFPPHQ